MTTVSAGKKVDSQDLSIEGHNSNDHGVIGEGGSRPSTRSKRILVQREKGAAKRAKLTDQPEKKQFTRDAYDLRPRKAAASQSLNSTAKTPIDIKKEIESAIKFSRAKKLLGPQEQNSGFLKALDIAEHFLNLDTTKAGFSKHKIGFSLLIEKAKHVSFKIKKKIPLNRATNWIILDQLQAIYLSDVFLEKLELLTVKEDDPGTQRETKIVVFGLAMAIVHAFGNLALESEPNALKSSDFDMTKFVFGKSLGLVCLNKDNKAWSFELPFAGLALESCTYQSYISDLFSEREAENDASKKNCQSSNNKKKKPERYRLMSESFIEMVYDRLDQVTDEYLKDRSNFETKTAPSDDHTVFKLHLENDPEVNLLRCWRNALSMRCGNYARRLELSRGSRTCTRSRA